MDSEDFDLVVQDLDELLAAEDIALSPVLMTTSECPFSNALFGEMKVPKSIRVTGAPDSGVTLSQGNESPSSQSSSCGVIGEDAGVTNSIDSRLAVRKTPLRRRVTMKQRILLLQDEADQLVDELHELQERSQTLQVQTGSIAKRAKFPQMWEAIATRQQTYRKKSETENTYLRTLVETQSRYLRSVQRVLRRQPARQEVNKVIHDLITTKIQRMPREFDRSSTFGNLLNRLSAQHARVDQSWAALGISDLPCPGRQCLTSRKTVRDEVRIEFINRASMPFKLDAVQEVVWSYIVDARLQKSTVQSAKIIDFRDCTIQAVLSEKCSLGVFEISNALSSVSRKFVEQDRVVFVTILMTELHVKNYPNLDGIKFFSTIVVMLKHGDILADGSRGTIVETSWSTQGCDADGVSKCPSWKLESFHDWHFSIEAMKAKIIREHELMEDLLVLRQCGGKIDRVLSLDDPTLFGV